VEEFFNILNGVDIGALYYKFTNVNKLTEDFNRGVFFK